MQALIRIVELGRTARNKAKIKVRQPLSEMLVLTPDESVRKSLVGVEYLIAEEINVKKVTFAHRGQPLVNYSVKPNFARLGPKLGKQVGLAVEKIKELSQDEILKLRNRGNLNLNLNGDVIEITEQEVEIFEQAKEGFAVETDGGYQVALNLSLTEELLDEGLARELVNRVQNLRKEAGLEVTDRIKLYLQTDDRVRKAIQSNLDYIKRETLSLDLLFERQSGSLSVDSDLNGHPTYLAVEKIR